jgi:type II secretory pathway component GspD/PulD (secretin)
VFKLQSADTTVTLQDGGVAVIGGLIEEREEKNNYKVPFFGDIPLVGKLCFQKTQSKDIKTHLIMFVKATVKDMPGAAAAGAQ